MRDDYEEIVLQVYFSFELQISRNETHGSRQVLEETPLMEKNPTHLISVRK